jgi:hypothetical protein
MASFFENAFAWVMIGAGVAILLTVRWRPARLWPRRGERRERPSEP